MVAVFAIDDENGAFDAAKKLDGLRRVKGLRRNSPMQRIKFPDPLALGMLLHSGPRQRHCQYDAQKQDRATDTDLHRINDFGEVQLKETGEDRQW